jgi:hypothetical protein
MSLDLQECRLGLPGIEAGFDFGPWPDPVCTSYAPNKGTEQIPDGNKPSVRLCGRSPASRLIRLGFRSARRLVAQAPMADCWMRSCFSLAIRRHSPSWNSLARTAGKRAPPAHEASTRPRPLPQRKSRDVTGISAYPPRPLPGSHKRPVYQRFVKIALWLLAAAPTKPRACFSNPVVAKGHGPVTEFKRNIPSVFNKFACSGIDNRNCSAILRAVNQSNHKRPCTNQRNANWAVQGLRNPQTLTFSVKNCNGRFQITEIK